MKQSVLCLEWCHCMKCLPSESVSIESPKGIRRDFKHEYLKGKVHGHDTKMEMTIGGGLWHHVEITRGR